MSSKSIVVKGNHFVSFFNDFLFLKKDTIVEELLIEVDGIEHDLVQNENSTDLIGSIGVSDNVCVTYGTIIFSVDGSELRRDAVNVFNEWVMDNNVQNSAINHMRGMSLQHQHQRIKKVMSNIESKDDDLTENSLDLLNSLNNVVKNTEAFIQGITLTPNERNLIAQEITGSHSFKSDIKRYVSNCFIVGEHVIVEVFNKGSKSDIVCEYWPFNRIKLANGDADNNIICESVDEAMLFCLCNKYDNDTDSMTYAARVINMK